tara:strand:- start:626 stop:1105 length:480 start_codon:yes stop_codon:yes gene_type:complete
MFQQSILDSLSSIFGQGTSWGDMSGFTGGDISSQIASMYDLYDEETGENMLDPSMFSTISPDMLRAASHKTYSPQIQAKGQSLLSGLYSGLGGQKARQAAGGFAGSSGFGKYQSGIKDVYGKEMTGAIAEAGQQRAQGLGNISDMISQWQETGQRFKFG